MDLLWFPTGGGKTEAYLGLIALTAFHRRFSEKEEDLSGVAAMMRYTLRLLTTQQFARSAAMIMACEVIRRGKVGIPSNPAIRGDEPFSIGLWVGREASPNKTEGGLRLSRRVLVNWPRQNSWPSVRVAENELVWPRINVSIRLSSQCANRKTANSPARFRCGRSMMTSMISDRRCLLALSINSLRSFAVPTSNRLFGIYCG